MRMNNFAAHYEAVDSDNQGGTKGSTIAAFRQAIDILAEKNFERMKFLRQTNLVK